MAFVDAQIEGLDARYICIPAVSLDRLLQEALAPEMETTSSSSPEEKSILDDLCPDQTPLPLDYPESSDPQVFDPEGQVPRFLLQPPLCTQATLTPVPSHLQGPVAHNQSHANQRRARRRQREKGIYGQLPSAKVQSLVNTASVATTSLKTLDLPVTSSGYSAKIKKATGAKKIYTKDELINQKGFHYVEWEGM